MDEYVVKIGGLPHTFQMSREEAERVGAVKVDRKPENKQRRQPRNKSRG